MSVLYVSTSSSSLKRIDCLTTRTRNGAVALVDKPPSCRNFASSIKYPACSSRSNNIAGFKRFSPVMEWQDCTVKKEINVPTSVAYNCYADREAIPNWMPFISTVKILEDKTDLSRWSLKYAAFGRDLEFSWIARNMQPISNQKIHWRSLEGLPNRGAVRFFPKGSSSCLVEAPALIQFLSLKYYGHAIAYLSEFGAKLIAMNAKLTVSYEVPQLLVPVASVSVVDGTETILGRVAGTRIREVCKICQEPLAE